MNCFKMAVELLEKGFSIIPIKPRGKEPLVPWTEFQKRQATYEEFERWFARWLDMNIAMVLGFNNLVVFDAGGPAGVAWVTDNLPKTGVYQQTSENKLHAFFQGNGEQLGTKIRFQPEVDLLAGDRYVLTLRFN